jgi:predicted ArsR family transcriptional regulator
MTFDRKPKRTPLEIKQEILKILKGKEMTLRLLEKKIDTNPETIKKQVNKLEVLGFLETIKHEKSKYTGRPYTTVKLLKT